MESEGRRIKLQSKFTAGGAIRSDVFSMGGPRIVPGQYSFIRSLAAVEVSCVKYAVLLGWKRTYFSII